MSRPVIKIYTDGSCSPNPGPGGWGVVIIPDKGKKRELSGKVPETTNNRMELQAALEAFRALSLPSAVELYTDSRYVKDGICSWVDTWRRRNWLTAAGEAVKNRDLWEALDKELHRHQVHWFWVKGHGRAPDNVRADALAVAARGRVALPLHDERAVHIFLGITWSQKKQIGSWAAVFRYQGHFKVGGGQIKDSSANRIHIQSANLALGSLTRRLPVHLYTSSGYLKDGASHWVRAWANNGWQTQDGREVKNREEWQGLAVSLAGFPVSFYVVDKEMPPCLSQEAKELAREWAQ